MKNKLADLIISRLDDETVEWYLMSPAERFEESQKLWLNFKMLGGSYDIQPDLQSPFYFQETSGPSSSHRRAGCNSLWGRGIQSRY